MFKKRVLCTVLLSQLLTSVSPVFASGSGSGLPPGWNFDSSGGPSLPRSLSSVAPSAALEHPVDLEEMERRYETGNLHTEDISRLLAIAQDNANPKQWDVIALLWETPEDQPTEHQAFFRPFAFEVANTPQHARQLQAIALLLRTPEALQPEEQALFRDTVRQAANTPEDPRQLDAMMLCWHLAEGDEAIETRTAFAPFLFKVAQDPLHPQQYDVLSYLWYSENAQDPSNREILRPALLQIAQNPEHPEQWEALGDLLFSRGVPNVQNRQELYPVLMPIAQNPEHPNQWIALNQLWNSGDDHQDQYREALFPALLKAAGDPENAHQWRALSHLWYSGGDRKALRPSLLSIAQNPEHPEQWDALIALWDSEFLFLGPSEGERARLELCPTFLKIAENAQHPQQLEAVKSLLHVRGHYFLEQFTEYNAGVRPILIALAQKPDSQHQRGAIALLRESDERADQELGLALQLQYFPIQPEFDVRAEVRP